MFEGLSHHAGNGDLTCIMSVSDREHGITLPRSEQLIRAKCARLANGCLGQTDRTRALRSSVGFGQTSASTPGPQQWAERGPFAGSAERFGNCPNAAFHFLSNPFTLIDLAGPVRRIGKHKQVLFEGGCGYADINLFAGGGL